MRRKRPAPLALVLLLGAGLLWWRGLGGGAVSGELLRKNPQDIRSVLVVRNGRLLWVDATQTPEAFLVRQMDVRGGKPSDLFRCELKGEVVLRTLFTGKELLYLTTPKSPGAERDAARSVMGSSGKQLYVSGPYRMPEKAGAKRPGETWRVLPRPIPRDQPPLTLHRVSLESREERTGQLDVQGYFLGAQRFALGADGLFWVRPGTRTRTVVLREKEGMAYELLPPRDDLMVTPLDGGPARVLASGVLLQWLAARGEGVYGGRPYAYPERDADGDLYRFSRSGNSPPARLPYGMRVGGLGGDSSAAGGVESEGRYYWLDRDPEADGEMQGVQAGGAPARLGGQRRRTNAGPVQLMSCRVDGSDIRPVCILADKRGEGLYPERLFAYRDRPYLICSQAIQPNQGRDRQGDALPQVVHYIARVHSEAADPLNGMRRLGMGRGTYNFSDLADEGYYYFYLYDLEKSPLDFLSSESTERHVTSFWRVRLPE